jgi:hypothetical protein
MNLCIPTNSLSPDTHVAQETVTVAMKQACVSKSPNKGNHLAFQATPISEDVSILVLDCLLLDTKSIQKQMEGFEFGT